MLYPDEHVIDDDTPDDHEFIVGEGYGRGSKGFPVGGYGAAAGTFPASLLIDESLWEGMIADKVAANNQLSQMMITAGLPCKNQQQTEFCWANASTHLEEIIRVQQNEQPVILSPASVACPITGFHNVGGYDKDAISRLSKFGAVPVANWPANAIDKSYMTAENLAIALNYRITNWATITPQQIKQIVSLALQNIPSAIGLPWWGHEVTVYDAIWLNGKIGLRCRNSWGMTYGHLGFFTIQGQKMYPGSGVAALSSTAA